MEYEFDRYDDDHGRLEVKGVSVPFPAPSQKWFRGDGFAVPAAVDATALAASGLFVPTRYWIEDNGEHYRIWKLTPAGREAVGDSRAA